jgi:hypothetical protein
MRNLASFRPASSLLTSSPSQPREMSARPVRPPAACAQAKDDARDHSQQPAQHGAREDDPDERSMAAPGHPAQFHLARVRDHERDQDDQERHETEREGVEPGVVALSAEPFPARLGTLGVRQFLLLGGFDLYLFSFSCRFLHADAGPSSGPWLREGHWLLSAASRSPSSAPRVASFVADRVGLGRTSCSGLSAEGGCGADRERLWPTASRGTDSITEPLASILAGIGQCCASPR